MDRRRFLTCAALVAATPSLSSARAGSKSTSSAGLPMILDYGLLKRYVEQFNRLDTEIYRQHVPNEDAFEFLKGNVPLLECPDKNLERTFHFRWWTYRKHVKKTPEGFVITEFLPDVSWARKYNTISCPAGHHFYEGRWIHDTRYLDDYARFWFYGGGSPRNYSFWAADAMYARYLADGRGEFLTGLLDGLVANYKAWEKSRLHESGLFWQIDDRDGMEVSISGSGLRPTINSYMYGGSVALAKIAELAGQPDLAEQYREKARRIKRITHEKLWHPEDRFFEVRKRETDRLADVRELLGYTPWYFNMPEARCSVAWKHLMDPRGFYAPYGPTTAEQRHPGFKVSYKGHACQWNGPSWPYATSQTLTALANLLNNYEQDVVTRTDYARTLLIYGRSHTLERKDGQIVPWIDENLNPYTGDWIARTRHMGRWGEKWPEHTRYRERGKAYNHSSFCDLVITGLIGLRPRADNVVEVNPLLPSGWWRYFCLDNVPYHGHALTILWDQTGERYGRGKGLHVYADGKEIAASETLGNVQGMLPAASA